LHKTEGEVSGTCKGQRRDSALYSEEYRHKLQKVEMWGGDMGIGSTTESLARTGHETLAWSNSPDPTAPSLASARMAGRVAEEDDQTGDTLQKH
jgi:hypothetical protein